MLTLMFDPGRSSGIVLGEYSDEQPWTFLMAWQVIGGASGLNRWRSENIDVMYGEERGWEFLTIDGMVTASFYGEIEVAAEKWVPYPTPGHSATLDSTYPLVCEGVLIHAGLMPDEYPHPAWSRSSDQYPFDAPPETPKAKQLAVKKKLRQDWLKKHDLWLTGKDVGQPNADDAISALSHQLVRMKKMRHMPTLETYFSDNKEEK